MLTCGVPQQALSFEHPRFSRTPSDTGLFLSSTLDVLYVLPRSSFISVFGAAPCPTLALRGSPESPALASLGLRCKRGVMDAPHDGRLSRLCYQNDNLPAVHATIMSYAALCSDGLTKSLLYMLWSRTTANMIPASFRAIAINALVLGIPRSRYPRYL